jgi:hypothetical protein
MQKNNNLSFNLNFWNNHLNCNSHTFLNQIVVLEFFFFDIKNVFSNMIYAWRDRNVYFIFKWALYSFFRACTTISSKSREKSKDDAQNTRFKDFWLFEKLNHQNSCSIKDLRSSARVEKN